MGDSLSANHYHRQPTLHTSHNPLVWLPSPGGEGDKKIILLSLLPVAFVGYMFAAGEETRWFPSQSTKLEGEMYFTKQSAGLFRWCFWPGT